MVVLNSGTATTRRLHGDSYPSYNQLLIRDKELSAYLIRTETGQKRLLAQYSLDINTNNVVNIPMSLTY